MPSKPKVRMAQYGTKHSHAPGVLAVTLANPDVEFAGVYEPDPAQRSALQTSGAAPWSQVAWLDDKAEILEDATIVAVSSEGSNAESLEHTEEIVAAGKHVFYDKPAGVDYPMFERIVGMARERGLLIQLGYMFRYHDGFARIANWALSGFLGHVFAVRAHMSTSLDLSSSPSSAAHRGGIFYDLASHMLDQVVWILGRPEKVSAFLRNDAFPPIGFKDNTLGVFEYDKALAVVDIAAMEPGPGGPALRGLRHRGLGDHGALRTRRHTAPVSYRTQGRISTRLFNRQPGGPPSLRGQPRRFHTRHPRREETPTVRWTTNCSSRKRCYAPPAPTARRDAPLGRLQVPSPPAGEG